MAPASRRASAWVMPRPRAPPVTQDDFSGEAEFGEEVVVGIRHGVWMCRYR